LPAIDHRRAHRDRVASDQDQRLALGEQERGLRLVLLVDVGLLKFQPSSIPINLVQHLANIGEDVLVILPGQFRDF
jgi:hypothetical protein